MIKKRKATTILSIVVAVVAIALIVLLAYFEMRNNGTIGSSQSKKIMEEFNEVYNSKEIEVIYYASSSCSYCKLQKPILETVADDYDIDYYSIDSNELSNSQRNEVLETLGIEPSTPTTVIVKNGEVVATQVGYVDGQGLVKFFSENDVIPEDAVYSAEEYITFIDYDEYKTLINNDEINIITIGQTACSHCISFKPAINSVGEDYGLTMNYLNLTEMTKEESNDFFESLEQIGYDDPDFVEDGSFGTPLTLIVENGKVKDYISGERTISQLVRELKKVGIIEE